MSQLNWLTSDRLSQLATDFFGGVYLFVHEGPVAAGHLRRDGEAVERLHAAVVRAPEPIRVRRTDGVG